MEKRFKDLLPGETFRLYYEGAFTAIKTEDGKACLLRDGSLHTVHHMKRVEILTVATIDYRVAQIGGKVCLVCPAGDQKQCHVLEFLVIGSDLVRNEMIEFIESREEIIEKRRQVEMLLNELEHLLKNTGNVLLTIKTLMSVDGKFGKIPSIPEEPETLKLSELWEKTAFRG